MASLNNLIIILFYLHFFIILVHSDTDKYRAFVEIWVLAYINLFYYYIREIYTLRYYWIWWFSGSYLFFNLNIKWSIIIIKLTNVLIKW